MKFDNTYKQEINNLEEGKLQSLALAGLLAAGAPEMASGASRAINRPATTSISPKSPTDQNLVNSTVDLTAWGEGFRDTMYLDSVGVPTIGYGTNLKEPKNVEALRSLGYDIKRIMKKSQKISDADAKKLMHSGLYQAVRDARALVPNFDSHPLKMKMILTDMSYNMGKTRLSGFHDFLANLSQKNYNGVKKEMIDSHWYKQTGKRSKALVSMMDEVIKGA